MPWGRVYALTPWDRQLRKHEIEHLRQIRHDGPVKFVALYLWWMIRRGYWWNPYEVAARIRSGEAWIEPGYQKHPELWRLIILPRRPWKKTSA